MNKTKTASKNIGRKPIKVNKYACPFCGVEYTMETKCIQHMRTCDFDPNFSKAVKCKNGMYDVYGCYWVCGRKVYMGCLEHECKFYEEEETDE